MEFSAGRINQSAQLRKIIFWVEDMPPTQGGIQKRIFDFIRGTKDHFDVIVVQRNGNREHFPNVKTITVSDSTSFFEASSSVILDQVMNSGLDPLIYVSKVFYFEDARHLQFLEYLSGQSCKVVMRLASSRSANFVNQQRYRINFNNIRFHCLNETDFHLIRSWHPDVLQFKNSSIPPAEPTPLIEQPSYAFCGRIVESKNLAALMYAWSAFNQPGKSLKIWGDNSSSYSARRVMPLVAAAPDAEYLGVFEGGDESIFKTFDFLVAPSTREGSSNVVVEAMSHGRIVVGSDIPGIQDLLPTSYPFLISPPFGRVEILSALEEVRRAVESEREMIEISQELIAFFLENLSKDRELEAIKLLAQPTVTPQPKV